MKRFIVTVVLILLATAALAGCSSESDAQAATAGVNQTTPTAASAVAQPTSTPVETVTRSTTTTAVSLATTTTTTRKTTTTVQPEITTTTAQQPAKPDYYRLGGDGLINWVVLTTYQVEVFNVETDEPDKLRVYVRVDGLDLVVQVNQDTYGQIGNNVQLNPDASMFAVEPLPGNSQSWEERFAGNGEEAREFLLWLNDPANLIIMRAK